MNLPNKLTLSRIIAIPFVMAGLMAGKIMDFWRIQSPTVFIFSAYFALIAFIAASLTDLYDGKIARQRKIVTPFGSFFDPIADKLLVSAVLICFVELRIMPAWMVVIIISREFIISGLRILAAREGVDIPAGPLGKYKTISQMVMIICVLIYLALDSSHHFIFSQVMILGYALSNWIYALLYFLMVWTVIATIISGYSYIKDHWHLIMEGNI